MHCVAVRSGRTNPLLVMSIAALALVAGLSLVLWAISRSGSGSGIHRNTTTGGETQTGTSKLFVYCAAGMRYPMQRIAEDYQRDFGIDIQLQYGGSNTLLNQLEVSGTGDLYLAADDSYMQLARKKRLLDESIPLAKMKPVIVVRNDNASVQSLSDLTKPGVKVALGNPDATAVGKKTRKLLTASGHWNALSRHVTQIGVFKPTVNEVANDVKLGAVDAGIIWDSTVAQYPDLKAISVPELDQGTAQIQIGILRSTKHATAALRFARYVGARDKGQSVFKSMGWETVPGDPWEVSPELTFFAGTVNRKALDPIIDRFEKREGVRVHVVYNDCGILIAQMRTLTHDSPEFPDAYMACDVYYLQTVQEMFEPGTNVSDTDIVIVVQKGNPMGIQSLNDLARPGVRVALGQPDQCTIGVLSRRLLQSENLYDTIIENNVVTQTATSALLVPNITTKAADAVLAYRTDTRAEAERLDVVDIDSPLAKAIQPFSTALSSKHKRLSQRLFDTVARSRQSFISAGFNWRLTESSSPATPDVETP